MKDNSKSTEVPVNHIMSAISGDKNTPTLLKDRFTNIEHMLSKGQISQAIQVLETYLAQDKNDSFIHVLLGEAYYAQKQFDLSLTHIHAAIEGPREPRRAIELLGFLASDKGQLVEAEQQMTLLLGNRIDELHIYKRRAIFRLNQRKYVEAAEDLSHILELAPGDKQTRTLLSYVQMLQGEFALAYQTIIEQPGELSEPDMSLPVEGPHALSPLLMYWKECSELSSVFAQEAASILDRGHTHRVQMKHYQTIKQLDIAKDAYENFTKQFIEKTEKTIADIISLARTNVAHRAAVPPIPRAVPLDFGSKESSSYWKDELNDEEHSTWRELIGSSENRRLLDGFRKLMVYLS